jgi:hypothetical protein
MGFEDVRKIQVRIPKSRYAVICWPCIIFDAVMANTILRNAGMLRDEPEK